MKYILVSDTHLGVKQGAPLYHQVTLDLFEQICETAEEHYAEGIIHLGDFFDNRKSINIKTILTAIQIMEMLDKQFTEIKLIVGNHDTIYKDDVTNTLLSMFKRYGEDIIVDTPTTVYGGILLVPWLFNHDILKQKTNCDILMGHFDIAGAVMNEAGTVSQHGISQSSFKNFEMVYSGHYHTPNPYPPNIRYLGSPFHTSFNDVDGERGYWLYNTDDKSCAFFEFDKYPKFRKVKDNDRIDELKPSYVKGNIVELIFTEDHGINRNLEIIEHIKNMEPLTLTPKYVSIDESMSQEDITEEDIEVKDHLGILHEYLEYSEQPEHINIDTLGQVADVIYKETVNGK